MRSNLDIFSDDQAITASAASTNRVSVGKFAGRGEPVTLRVRVTETFATLTSLAVSVREVATQTGGSPATLETTPAIVAATLVAGYEFLLRFVPKSSLQWIDLYYTVAGSDATAGKIAAEIVEGEDFPYVDGLFFDPRNPTGAASTA